MKLINFLKHHGNLVAALLAAIIFLTAALGYVRYVSQPLSQAAVLDKLPTGTTETVNTPLYQAIVKNLETKKEPVPAPSLEDPFRR